MTIPTFTQRVFDVVKKIPHGQTRTYQEVATLAGSPKAARAVGNILSKNFDLQIPCHRVIKANNQLGKYNRGRVLKKLILYLESEYAKILPHNL